MKALGSITKINSKTLAWRIYIYMDIHIRSQHLIKKWTNEESGSIHLWSQLLWSWGRGVQNSVPACTFAQPCLRQEGLGWSSVEEQLLSIPKSWLQSHSGKGDSRSAVMFCSPHKMANKKPSPEWRWAREWEVRTWVPGAQYPKAGGCQWRPAGHPREPPSQAGLGSGRSVTVPWLLFPVLQEKQITWF